MFLDLLIIISSTLHGEYFTQTSSQTPGGFLISDGSKRDFGCEGIQALAQGCKKLKSLHLDDCFRVQDFALRALAGALELEKLSLKDCYSIKERGICE